MKKTDKLHKEIAECAYDDFEVGKEAYTKEKYLIGTTIDYANNRSGHGEKIYAIVSNGPGILPESSKEERALVKEITLLFQGSTSPLKLLKGRIKEVNTDWYKNNWRIIKNLAKGKKEVAEQQIAAAKYLQEIINNYPNSQINIYGHSLGSMNAQYALATVTDYNRINYAHIYNAPNIYSILTDNEKANISELYPKIYNYVDSRDYIALNYGKGKGAVGQVFKFKGSDSRTENELKNKTMLGFIESTIIKLNTTIMFPSFGLPIYLSSYLYAAKFTQHMWGGFKFDEDGNLIDKSGERVFPLAKPEEISKFEKKLHSK